MRFTEDTDLFEDKLQKGRTGHFSKKDSGNRKHAPTTGTRAAERTTRVLKRAWPLWINW